MNLSQTKLQEKQFQKLMEKSVKPAKYDFRYNIRNYVNYSRFIISFVTALFFIGGSYYAFFLTPKYDATVLLSSKIYGSLSADALSTDKMIPVDDKDTAAPRQLAILQSYELLQKLVERLHLDIEIASPSSTIASNRLKIENLALPMKLLKKPVYFTKEEGSRYKIAIPSVYFEGNGENNKVETFTFSDGSSMTVKVADFDVPTGSAFTVTKQPQGEVINDLKSNLIFDAPGLPEKLVTNIVSIVFTGLEPEKVVQTVNTLAEIAVETSKEEERKEATYMTALLENEKKRVIAHLVSKGEEIAILSGSLNHVAYDEKLYGKLFVDELAQLENNIALAYSELAKISQSYTENHQIHKESNAAYQSLVDKKEKTKEMVSKSVAGSRLINDVQRDITIYTSIYEQISANLEQFQARIKEPVGNLRIINYATLPDTPSSLSRPVIILLSVFLGLVSGYVLALVLD